MTEPNPKEALNDEEIGVTKPSNASSSNDMGYGGDSAGFPSRKMWILILAFVAVVGVPAAHVLSRKTSSNDQPYRLLLSLNENPFIEMAPPSPSELDKATPSPSEEPSEIAVDAYKRWDLVVKRSIWDVQGFGFYASEDCTGDALLPVAIRQSAPFIRDWDPANFTLTTLSGGLPDENGDVWIGVDFTTPVAVRCIKLQADGAGVAVHASNGATGLVSMWTQTEFEDTESGITKLHINEMDSSMARFVVEPEISAHDVTQVMDWIKAEMTKNIIPFCWKHSYGRGVGTIPGRPADCPSKYTNDGLTCRLPPHDLYSPSAVANCPSGYTNDGLTCRLPPHDLYSPSVVANCPSGYTNDGLTCRRPPKDTSSPSKVANCPADYTNTGLTCFRGLETYSKYCTTIFKTFSCKSGYVDMGCHCHRDAHSLGLGSMTCPAGYSKGEPFVGRCYKRCEGDSTRVGENCHTTLNVKGLESMTCPAGYSKGEPFAGRCYKTCEGGRTRIGENCHRLMDVKGLESMTCAAGYFKGEPFAGRCYEKCEGGRTRIGENCHRTMVVKGVESMTCKEDEEKIVARCFKDGGCKSNEEWRDGLCYPKCNSGFNGIGPVCWQYCDSSQFECAAACASNEEECATTTVDQVIAPLVIAANIATLGLGGTGMAASSKVAKTHGRIKKLAKILDSDKLKKLADGIEAIDGVQDALKVYKKTKPARTGINLINAADTVNTFAGMNGDAEQIYEAVTEYTTAYAEEFIALTSQEISDQLDRSYEPLTSTFLKNEWAMIQFTELAEANNWDIASNALIALDLVDPTGVVGAVAAYAKPICKATKNFPCIIADLSYDSGCVA